jgi:hypothetical protein
MAQRKEPFPYEDIVELQRPEAGSRRRMPVSDRAAQFLPFAALTGYDAAVKETERLMEEEYENCIFKEDGTMIRTERVPDMEADCERSDGI